jgi:hypothetical protein
MALVDDSGKLTQLDSLTILDLVIALEEDANLHIPVENLRAEMFASTDALVAMIDSLPDRSRRFSTSPPPAGGVFRDGG